MNDRPSRGMPAAPYWIRLIRVVPGLLAFMAFPANADSIPPARTNTTTPDFGYSRATPAPRVPDAKCPLPAIETGKQIPLAISNKPQDRDRACLISLDDATQLQLKKNVQFVDVRSAADYGLAHMPEAIHIPLHLVKTKSFLKNINVILVDAGRSTSELVSHCVTLRQQGFKQVSVLDGGLQAWHAARRPLTGQQNHDVKLNRMSTAELFIERQYTDWLVIHVSSKALPQDMRQWLPNHLVNVPMKAVGQQVDAIREAIAQRATGKTARKVLILAEDDTANDRLEARLRSKYPSILYLSGGVGGYQSYVKKQIAIWNQQNQPRRLSACRG